MKKLLSCLPIILFVLLSFFQLQGQTSLEIREHIKLDYEWKFAFGHPYDTQKDFDNGTGYFSYIAKAGYGDGAASADFDDRAWRTLDLPHDWAAEAPFDGNASHSHGYKAVGRNFPERSVGWYRKTITIAEEDLGKKISLTFDGVSRNSIVWVNGFYLGTEPSGYSSFQYDITDYLNYGGENIIAVRADATMEEGWFYEGAGIYRHVWLTKTAPLHVIYNGTFITSIINGSTAEVTARSTIINEGHETAEFTFSHSIIDPQGKLLSESVSITGNLSPQQSKEYSQVLVVENPQLWSIESPYLYRALTIVKQNGKIIDQYETIFGIRTIRFDADKGFFLNGKHVKLKGTNNHQDHAGVGAAIPDELQEFRIATLKSMGSNAYRCSHNPPTPELLDACDRLGMVVIDENRLMGITYPVTDHMKRMIQRDRNHPSIIAWSIGNEEWAIEGNIKGARIAATMRDIVKTMDTTRPVNAALSGGWYNGISLSIDVMGFNYLAHGSTDDYHAKYPTQPTMGTEEGSTFATRGIYFTDDKTQYIAAYDLKPRSNWYTIEGVWKHYYERDYLGGMFIWTGFDYRGESTPHDFPSVTSYFGMLDICGFPKDNYYYLKSWWSDAPTLHVLPHWNWKGKEREEIDVWVYSNCDEVELFLNDRSLGRKAMELNSHLEWKVKYKPGAVKAIGYKGGKQMLTEEVKTTNEASSIQLISHKKELTANKEGIAVITVRVNDNSGLPVPTANNEIFFSVEGPAKIIGVGNGDPTSHEQDRFIESYKTIYIDNLKEKKADDAERETALVFEDSNWTTAFSEEDKRTKEDQTSMVYRGSFELPENYREAGISFFFSSIGTDQAIYINGSKIAPSLPDDHKKHDFKLDTSILRPGKNIIAIVAVPLKKQHEWDNVNRDPGMFQLIFPAEQWKRKLFNGMAQVIIQSTDRDGEIKLTANAPGLEPKTISIISKK